MNKEEKFILINTIIAILFIILIFNHYTAYENVYIISISISVIITLELVWLKYLITN